MNAPSVDLKAILVTDGVGTFTVDLFIGKEPESPDNCVTLRDTPGFSPERHANYRPSLQALIRNNDYQAAYTKAWAVYASLHEKTNYTTGGTRYIQILAAADPLYVGQDEQGRTLFSVNFDIRRTG